MEERANTANSERNAIIDAYFREHPELRAKRSCAKKQKLQQQ